MFPVRKELVGKRFAFIRGDGRTGTRHRGSQAGLHQNWNTLSWVTGTILASNIEALDAQNESVVSKKVKVFVEYDGRYQLPKEWIKLYSGIYRIFLIEENLVLCQRSSPSSYPLASCGWPALRLVPIVDKNFLDEHPHLIPVEFMGGRKELSFIVFEDIIQLFPNEDQTLLLQSVQQDRYLKDDYQRWERIQKTQMILLFGPYSLTGCRVEILEPSSGRCFRAVIIKHDYMKRVLDVMDDQLLKSRKINPRLIQINFLASDEEIDKLMYGEAPNSIPTRYSRYGHQVQGSRSQMHDFQGEPANNELSQFTLPQWMTNNSLMNPDQYQNNQSLHQDYRAENNVPGPQGNNMLPFCDERGLETTTMGMMGIADHTRPMIDLQNGIQKQHDSRSYNDPAKMLVTNESLHQNLHNTLSPKTLHTPPTSLVSPAHQVAQPTPRYVSPLHQKAGLPFAPKDQQHYSSPASSIGSPAHGIDIPLPERPGTAPCIDTNLLKKFSPSSPFTSPKTPMTDMYQSPSRLSSSLDNSPYSFDRQSQHSNSPSTQEMMHSCGQSPYFGADRGLEKRHSTGQPVPRKSSNPDRTSIDYHRRSSLPDKFPISDRSEFPARPMTPSSASFSESHGHHPAFSTHHPAQEERQRHMLMDRSIDRSMQQQFQSMNITESDLSHFLNQLDAWFNVPTRTPQQTQNIHSQIKNFLNLSNNQMEHFQVVRNMLNTTQENPEFPREDMLAHFQQKLASYYSHIQSSDQPDLRQFQDFYDRQMRQQLTDQNLMALQSSKRNCPSAPPQSLSRSMSVDNFHTGSVPFGGMTPPTGLIKKPKQTKTKRKPRRSKSKDDTAETSQDTSNKISSLSLSQEESPGVKDHVIDHPITPSKAEELSQPKPKAVQETIQHISNVEASEPVSMKPQGNSELTKQEEQLVQATEIPLPKAEYVPQPAPDGTCNRLNDTATFKHETGFQTEVRSSEVNAQENSAQLSNRMDTLSQATNRSEGNECKEAVPTPNVNRSVEAVSAPDANRTEDDVHRSDISAQVALAAAGFHHGLAFHHGANEQTSRLNENQQKLPSEAKWFENVVESKPFATQQDTMAHADRDISSEMLKDIGSKGLLSVFNDDDDDDDTIEQPPSPEFLPVKDKDTDLTTEQETFEKNEEFFKKVSAISKVVDMPREEKDSIQSKSTSSHFDKESSLDPALPTEMPSLIRDQHKKHPDEMNDSRALTSTGYFQQEQQNADACDSTAVKTRETLGEMSFKNVVGDVMIRKGDESESTKTKEMKAPTDVGDQSTSKYDSDSMQSSIKKDLGFSKVPIASLPVTSLGISPVTMFGNKDNGGGSMKPVKNMYGRTLYYTGQTRGPNLAQHVRTDKIIDERKNKLVDLALKKPFDSGNISTAVASVNQKPKEEEQSCNDLQTDPTGVPQGYRQLPEERQLPDSTKEETANLLTMNTEATSLETVLANVPTLPIPTSLSELLDRASSANAKKSDYTKKGGAEKKSNQVKKLTVKDKSKRKKVCRHKRKPCKCDLEAVASLASLEMHPGAPVDGNRTFTAESPMFSPPESTPIQNQGNALSRFDFSETSVMKDLSTSGIMDENKNQQSLLDFSGNDISLPNITPTIEPSFSILESKEIKDDVFNIETTSIPSTSQSLFQSEASSISAIKDSLAAFAESVAKGTTQGNTKFVESSKNEGSIRDQGWGGQTWDAASNRMPQGNKPQQGNVALSEVEYMEASFPGNAKISDQVSYQTDSGSFFQRNHAEESQSMFQGSTPKLKSPSVKKCRHKRKPCKCEISAMAMIDARIQYLKSIEDSPEKSPSHTLLNDTNDIVASSQISDLQAQNEVNRMSTLQGTDTNATQISSAPTDTKQIESINTTASWTGTSTNTPLPSFAEISKTLKNLATEKQTESLVPGKKSQGFIESPGESLNDIIPFGAAKVHENDQQTAAGRDEKQLQVSTLDSGQFNVDTRLLSFMSDPASLEREQPSKTEVRTPLALTKSQLTATPVISSRTDSKEAKPKVKRPRKTRSSGPKPCRHKRKPCKCDIEGANVATEAAPKESHLPQTQAEGHPSQLPQTQAERHIFHLPQTQAEGHQFSLPQTQAQGHQSHVPQTQAEGHLFQLPHTQAQGSQFHLPQTQVQEHQFHLPQTNVQPTTSLPNDGGKTMPSNEMQRMEAMKNGMDDIVPIKTQNIGISAIPFNFRSSYINTAGTNNVFSTAMNAKSTSAACTSIDPASVMKKDRSSIETCGMKETASHQYSSTFTLPAYAALGLTSGHPTTTNQQNSIPHSTSTYSTARNENDGIKNAFAYQNGGNQRDNVIIQPERPITGIIRSNRIPANDRERLVVLPENRINTEKDKLKVSLSNDAQVPFESGKDRKLNSEPAVDKTFEQLVVQSLATMESLDVEKMMKATCDETQIEDSAKNDDRFSKVSLDVAEDMGCEAETAVSDKSGKDTGEKINATPQHQPRVSNVAKMASSLLETKQATRHSVIDDDVPNDDTTHVKTEQPIVKEEIVPDEKQKTQIVSEVKLVEKRENESQGSLSTSKPNLSITDKKKSVLSNLFGKLVSSFRGKDSKDKADSAVKDVAAQGISAEEATMKEVATKSTTMEDGSSKDVTIEDNFVKGTAVKESGTEDTIVKEEAMKGTIPADDTMEGKNEEEKTEIEKETHIEKVRAKRVKSATKKTSPAKTASAISKEVDSREKSVVDNDVIQIESEPATDHRRQRRGEKTDGGGTVTKGKSAKITETVPNDKKSLSKENSETAAKGLVKLRIVEKTKSDEGVKDAKEKKVKIIEKSKEIKTEISQSMLKSKGLLTMANTRNATAAQVDAPESSDTGVQDSETAQTSKEISCITRASNASSTETIQESMASTSINTSTLTDVAKSSETNKRSNASIKKTVAEQSNDINSGTSKSELTLPLARSNSFTISVPTSISIPNAALSSTGNKITTKAKIVCPEKTLIPMKGTPVNVSFDGGKTFTLANIIEIRNNVTSGSPKPMDVKTVDGVKSEGQKQELLKPAFGSTTSTMSGEKRVINAVLLGVTPPPDLNIKSVKLETGRIENETEVQPMKRTRRQIKSSLESPDSSDDINGTLGIKESKSKINNSKEAQEKVMSPKVEAKATRRSSRFHGKNQTSEPFSPRSDVSDSETGKSFRESMEDIVDSLFPASESENSGDLSDDPSYSPQMIQVKEGGRSGRSSGRKSGLVKQRTNLEGAENKSGRKIEIGKKRDGNKKTIMTSKDEMFDCCDVHHDLFCQKCTPFKDKAGLWPAGSRAKEINAAWRAFMKKCEKHHVSKCNDCPSPYKTTQPIDPDANEIKEDLESVKTSGKSQLIVSDQQEIEETVEIAIRDSGESREKEDFVQKGENDTTNESTKSNCNATQETASEDLLNSCQQQTDQTEDGGNAPVGIKDQGFQLVSSCGPPAVTNFPTESPVDSEDASTPESLFDILERENSLGENAAVVDEIVHGINEDGVLGEEEETLKIEEPKSGDVTLKDILSCDNKDSQGDEQTDSTLQIETIDQNQASSLAVDVENPESKDTAISPDFDSHNEDTNVEEKIKGIVVRKSKRKSIPSKKHDNEIAHIFKSSQLKAKHEGKNVPEKDVVTETCNFSADGQNKTDFSHDSTSDNEKESVKTTAGVEGKTKTVSKNGKTDTSDKKKEKVGTRNRDGRDSNDEGSKKKKREKEKTVEAEEKKEFDLPERKCIIHGRLHCGLCGMFYKEEGEWPSWARRGEVRFAWESRSDFSGLETKKCRIHLRNNCVRCTPFKIEEGSWPSWLRRDEVEGKYYMEKFASEEERRRSMKKPKKGKRESKRLKVRTEEEDDEGSARGSVERKQGKRKEKGQGQKKAKEMKEQGQRKYKVGHQTRDNNENGVKMKKKKTEKEGDKKPAQNLKETSLINGVRVKKTDICILHKHYFCIRCFELRQNEGKWPEDHLAVERNYKRRGKLKKSSLESWNSCVLHAQKICLPCFNFWHRYQKPPRNEDKDIVEGLWDELREEIEDIRCDVHRRQYCKFCTPVYITEGEFPNFYTQLKAAYSWQYFETLLSNYAEDEERLPGGSDRGVENDGEEELASHESQGTVTEAEIGSPEKENSSSQIGNESSNEASGKVPGTKLKYKLKVAKKFYCKLHDIFPCFMCMSRFVQENSWPGENDRNDIISHWTAKWPNSVFCTEHKKMFCKKCTKLTELFKHYKEPGVTDNFRKLVREDIKARRAKLDTKTSIKTSEASSDQQASESESGCGKQRKRKYRETMEEDDYIDDNGNMSVSFSGRVRNKVSRPGTVDISKLADDFLERENKASRKQEVISARKKGLTKIQDKPRKKVKVDKHATEVEARRKEKKRGRPRKRSHERDDEIVPKKKRKVGLAEQIRSGALKIVNVNDLREQLKNERQRDPSPTHLEYVQLLENAEKMNVKYFAISAEKTLTVIQDSSTETEDKAANVVIDSCNTDSSKSEEITDGGAAETVHEDAVKDEPVERSSDVELVPNSNKVASSQEEAGSHKSSKSNKLGGICNWSKKDVELILEKVEKAALAAKEEKQAAYQKKKYKHSKKPLTALTVAQVLAIKRNKGNEPTAVLDQSMQEDLKKMLAEAERRNVDLDTLVEEAVKTKNKTERQRQRVRKKTAQKLETFLQEHPCDQTPKLPKCRDCRVVDKRDADQHAFCRFVMFRRLRKKLKTGKLESAGFCSPKSATESAFIPWAMNTKDVDMKASICHYIIKNIAGQFCAVVEEECNALMLGTKDGAVGWKRAVAGVREMCDACATTIFNIHWVCEKCGFGVCLDCYRSKINEQVKKDEGYKAFEFHWFSCAPGLAHKPHNLTVTQIIPKDALWDLCQSTLDVCTVLNIPFKLSENVLKKSMPFQLMPSPPQRTSVIRSTPSQLTTPTQESVTVVEPAIPSDSGLSIKLSHISSEFNIASSSHEHTSLPSLSTAMCNSETTSPEERNNDIADEIRTDGTWTQALPSNAVRPVSVLPPMSGIEKESAFSLSSEPPSAVSALEQNSKHCVPVINVSPLSTNGGCITNTTQMKMNDCETASLKCDERFPENSLGIFSNAIFNTKEESNNSSTAGPSFVTTTAGASIAGKLSIDNPVVTTMDTNIATVGGAITTGSPVETTKREPKGVVEDRPEDHEREEAFLYYKSVCQAAASVVSNIQIWKAESETMIETDAGFEEDEKPNVDIQPKPMKVEDRRNVLPDRNENIDVIMPRKIENNEVVMMNEGARNDSLLPNKEAATTEINRVSSAITETSPIANEIQTPVNEDHGINSFSNSLDILAMVASGFFGATVSTNRNEVEDVKPVEIPDTAPQSFPMAEPPLLPPSLSDPLSSSQSFAAHSIVDTDTSVVEEYPVSSYLCDGTLLQLNYSRHPDNVSLFRKVWKKGFPLIVSRVDKLLRRDLWAPESFAEEFGHEVADVVNCRSGEILHQFSVGDFWKGFESVKDRPVDNQDRPMLLKLKDWPPGADFCEKMPGRFEDLMNAIPLPDYTRRDGQWNLVSRLPTNHFIKPDLGPKMYNAYGSAAVPNAGTTNLHLDMSDAVNVMFSRHIAHSKLKGPMKSISFLKADSGMVYVGVPRDPVLGDQEIEDALETVDIACCDATKKRVRQKGVIPGALWHIYAAEDADKIRKFLHKIAEERKLKYSIYNDPIHDQSFYLDHDLRGRLKDDYGVVGFAICQCLGDAVFIPAGAPHQVLNLHSCVKVAEDFVSPERIGQCFNLTQEFRYLSDRHTNHEDKLQVKNIIYHAVKDSVGVLKEELKKQKGSRLIDDMSGTDKCDISSQNFNSRQGLFLHTIGEHHQPAQDEEALDENVHISQNATEIQFIPNSEEEISVNADKPKCKQRRKTAEKKIATYEEKSMKRKSYDFKFKRRVIKAVSSGKCPAKVAVSFEITKGMVSKWVRNKAEIFEKAKLNNAK